MSEDLNTNYVDDVETGFPLPSRRTRRNIVVVTLFVMWGMIWYILMQGDAANSLHQSALSWAFITSIGVTFAYVFGAVVDNWGVWKNMGGPKS